MSPAVALLAVLVLAKVLVLATRPMTLSPWAPIAYFSEDVAVAAVAVGLDLLVRRRRPRLAWAMYGAAVLWVALNVPVAVVLGSPLTAPMLRAARGPLADSITEYLTLASVARVLICALAGLVLPMALTRLKRALHFEFCILNFEFRSAFLLPVAAAISLWLAPIAAAHVDTTGLDRNAFTALLPVRLPAVSAVSAAAGPADLRASPFGVLAAPDLGQYRGAARGMNVLMVVLESAAARYLRPYGAAEDPMPHLTALSARALRWESAYAVYPESIKGLFATLCARYPRFNAPAEALASMPCAPFPEAMRAAGYQTGLFHSGRFGYLGMDTVLQGKGFDVLEDAGAIGGRVRSSFGVDEPATVDRLLAWVDSMEKGRPFLAAYLPIAGHHPYATPEAGPFQTSDPIGPYRNALHYADAALGRLLDGLRARRLSDRTLVVVFGDHGEAFGQHPGNVGHTLFVHDENVRVPYLVHIPGVTRGPIPVPAVASLIDTAPTILDLLGLAVPAGYHGLSLLDPRDRLAFFFTDYARGWLGLRDGCWKSIVEVGPGASRSTLYDVCRDPDETADLSTAAPDRASAYRERIGELSRLVRN